MITLSFKEVIQLGFKEVTARCTGYQEGRVFLTWQPFSHIREITFKVVPLGSDDGYLEHKTFILRESEDELTYIWKGDKVYVEDPEIMADLEC